ncbi:MAG: porphobilinogen synthase [Bacteroidetes bacterium]|nr:porphobilinogen synthase [Bacteroidota bacterium]
MQRLRRFRKNKKIRNKYAEVQLAAEDFIHPYFVVAGSNIKKEIASLQGVYHLSIDKLLLDIEESIALGLNKIILFGVINNDLKDNLGSKAYENANLVAVAIKKIKEKYPQLIVIADVCLCGYTDHGHCGILNGHDVDNDATLPFLAKIALSYAHAGADFVAPSAMMDGQVEIIRKVLNKKNLTNIKILAYAAKYSSSFYGPFRGAVNCSIANGDRSTYQMDYRTQEQALMEVDADIKEGCDWVMVKPAHTYLDIIHKIKLAYPEEILVGYQVSGEYMMIKVTAERGFFDEQEAMLEALTAIKRSGANYIISYYAKDYLKMLR